MSGLHLELFIQQIEYVRDMTHAAGIRLLIHDQSQMPFPEDEGVNIPPGAETEIGMMKVHIKRLKSPYSSHCTDGENIRNFYQDKYAAGYTREGGEGLLAKQDEELSAQRSDGLLTEQDKDLSRQSQASPGNCVELYEFKFAHDDLNCHCPLQCKEELYELTVSGSQWPSSSFIENFSKELKEIGGQVSIIANDPALIRDNFVKVVVYFKQLNYELIEQEPSMTEIDLISNMGGLVGLWVGFSVCTLVEFFELLVDVLLFFLRRCLRMVPSTVSRRPSTQKPNHIYITRDNTKL
ncbi:hypothetical protein NDU88_011977 [Pleurodeles waltl]|uniref:Uncharacterized protein n=1 Tax=Pleurodeles waltl TaxID=8319 RepID=A0AAV7QYW2_PLEWA|nr:hypothetical protein NDU88_011977 [Pleurodeles waltl]